MTRSPPWSVWAFTSTTAFNPDLPRLVVLPVGEERKTVAGAHDGFEVVVKLVEVEALVHDLRHVVGGLNVEGDVGDNSERAQADDGGFEGVAVAGAGKGVNGGRRRRRTRGH